MSKKKFTSKIKETARKHNLPESVVEEIFNSQFKFYKETVDALPIKDIETEEEFNKLKTVFYLKYIGKFYIKWNLVSKVKANINNKKEENKDE